MIGAVGGTMGLCIGFSFREVSGVLFRYIGIGIKKVQNVSATNDASVVIKKFDRPITVQKLTLQREIITI